MILTHAPRQVAKDNQLLDTARDYFQFTTNFFEVINVSATHIYHSALELSPLSSVVRKFYHSQRPHPSPRVVVGVPDSWDPSTASVSTKTSCYISSTWSPCGQFVAAVTEEAVEIRDALALKLLSTLRPTSLTARLRRGLAYSSDGHSLACCSDTAIIIWDTQTGGVVGKIKCEVTGNGLELVWSFDGKTICTISPRVSGTLTAHTYEVISGATQSSGAVQSTGGAHLWAHNESFRIMTTAGDRKGWTINIYQVGSALTKVEQFPFRSHFAFGVFSPTTHRTSVFVVGDNNRDHQLLILDARNSGVLLQETGRYWNHSFSPDGSVFSAFAGDHLPIWRYTSGRYTRWREFRQAPMSLQFSPTLSSILGHAGTLLHVLHLDYSPPALAMESAVITHGRPLDTFSPHGTYIATVHPRKSTVAITNLHPQNPSHSQLIDTNLEISAMVLTGNVLLVKGSDTVVAWLLTGEGVVDGIFDDRMADRNDSLWDISPRAHSSFWARLLQREGGDGDGDGDNALEFSVEGEIAAIRHNGHVVRVYHTRTGEILGPEEAPLGAGYRFHNSHPDACDLYHRDLRKHYEPLRCDWSVSQAALRGGWVKDPGGKRRLWLHARWRSAGNDVDWLDKVTTLRLKNTSELVVIKF